MQSVYSNTQYSEFHLSVFVCTYVRRKSLSFIYLFFVNYIACPTPSFTASQSTRLKKFVGMPLLCIDEFLLYIDGLPSFPQYSACNNAYSVMSLKFRRSLKPILTRPHVMMGSHGNWKRRSSPHLSLFLLIIIVII